MTVLLHELTQRQEVKLERDHLVEENEKLVEANKRYRMHTTELKEKVESLAVSESATTKYIDVHEVILITSKIAISESMQVKYSSLWYYHTIIQEEKKIIEAQQDQIEFLQDKLQVLGGAGEGEGEGATGEPNGSGEPPGATTETDTGGYGSHSEPPVIPPAPPPPPIDGVPMAPAFGMYALQ